MSPHKDQVPTFGTKKTEDRRWLTGGTFPVWPGFVKKGRVDMKDMDETIQSVVKLTRKVRKIMNEGCWEMYVDWLFLEKNAMYHRISERVVSGWGPLALGAAQLRARPGGGGGGGGGRGRGGRAGRGGGGSAGRGCDRVHERDNGVTQAGREKVFSVSGAPAVLWAAHVLGYVEQTKLLWRCCT
jgi:hypothetical protein